MIRRFLLSSELIHGGIAFFGVLALTKGFPALGGLAWVVMGALGFAWEYGIQKIVARLATRWDPRSRFSQAWAFVAGAFLAQSILFAVATGQAIVRLWGRP
jgi:hypothetical protein